VPSVDPDPSTADDTTARQALVDHARTLVEDGLVVGTAGNLSVAVEGGLLVTPSSLPYHDATAADMVLLDHDGTRLAGDRLPTSEWQLHLAVHAAHAPGAIVHTHAPAATAVSTLVTELPAIHYYVELLGGPPRVAPYATFGTAELAANVNRALGGRTAALMANHGAVTLGATLQEAVDRARTLEWLCEVYLRACSAGTPQLLTTAQLDDVDRRLEQLRRDLAD
jgi:L-fuculose-phosphate aldolase